MTHSLAEKNGARYVALVWLLACAGSALVALVWWWLEPSPVVRRQHIGQWSGVPAWISIAACVLLLYLSKSKDAETVSATAQAASAFAAGGLLSCLILQFGLLPRWLAQPGSLLLQWQVAILLILHIGCAWCAWRRWSTAKS